MAARTSNPTTRFVGLDSWERQIKAAQAMPADLRLTFQQARVDGRLPFDDASVDVAYSNNLLECIADKTAFLREVAGVLRPGGQVLFAHWDWDSQIFDGSDKALVRKLIHTFADWQQPWMEHSDPWMGRRLWGAFQETGDFDGEVLTRVLTNITYAEPWYGHREVQDLGELVKHGLVSAEPPPTATSTVSPATSTKAAARLNSPPTVSLPLSNPALPVP